MSVIMSFSSTTGSFSFPAEEMPLFGRRLEFQRKGDQGYGNRRINCELQGFFDRKSHEEIIQAYQELLNVIKANDAEFVYNVTGIGDVIRKQVYIDSYADPADWKEYQGDYSINFHYYEQPDFSTATLGITASYVPDTGGAYQFVQTPMWSSSLKPTRTSWRSPSTTLGGTQIGGEASIQLTGQLTADSYSQMKQKVDELMAAFSYDGTLHYGTWSSPVRVDDIQVPQSFPRDFLDYTISLKYDTQDLIEFKSKANYSRVHLQPKIKEYPFCGTRRIRLFNPSAQQVNYYIFIRAKTLALARTHLANEAANLIVPGGIEMPGGTEEHSDDERTITLSCTKYYDTPILNNVAGS